MKSFLYGVRDKVAGTFGSPFMAVNDDVAKRQFAFAFKDERSLLASSPSDYELHLLGCFDQETGIIEPIADLIIARGDDYAVQNPFSPSERFFCASGEKTRPVYKAELDRDGQLKIVEDGIEDVYAYIQSFKDSVDVNLIVSRYAAGDAYALEQSSGVYGDFIEVPSSYIDILNSVVDLRNAYEKTDMKVSFDEFANSVINPAVKAVEENLKKEVVEDVQKSEQSFFSDSQC